MKEGPRSTSKLAFSGCGKPAFSGWGFQLAAAKVPLLSLVPRFLGLFLIFYLAADSHTNASQRKAKAAQKQLIQAGFSAL